MKYIFAIIFAFSLSFALQSQDIFEVKFTSGFTQHRCALVLFNNGTALMRVRYYSDGTKMVEQSMKVENTRFGLRLTGYNPVYPGTNIRFTSYNADNFYISVNEYGNYSITNIDDKGAVAKVYVRKIEGKYLRNAFLKDFNWRL